MNIRQVFVKAHKNSFFTDSAVMVVGYNLASGLSYLYHLIIGRLLGPADYSDLAALFSLIALIGILPTSLNLVIAKYISKSTNKKEIIYLIEWFNKRIYFTSFIVFAGILLLSPFISSFLNIKNYLIIWLTGALFIFSFPTLLNYAILQGLLKFKELVICNLAANFTKILFGILLILIGFASNGAFVGLLISGWLTWLLSRYYLRRYKPLSKTGSPDITNILSYAVPILVQSIALTSIYSSDVVLVKHFFNPHQAGIYASLSTLGRIVYFAVFPVTAVMFPMVSKRFSLGQDYFKIFFSSFILSSLMAGFILVIYLLLPSLSINILYGKLYLEGAELLFRFGLFMTLFTLSTVFINFHLSIGDTRVVFLPVLAAIGQIIGIWIYHQSLYQVILVSLITNSLLLISLFVYFWYGFKVNLRHRPSL